MFKKTIILLSTIAALASTSIWASDTIALKGKEKAKTMAWMSKDSTDVITAYSNMVEIVVDDYRDVMPTPIKNTGVNVTNCSNFKHLDPKSDALCYVIDDRKPVTFSADSAQGSSGTVSVK
jgi:hypothetical protein